MSNESKSVNKQLTLVSDQSSDDAKELLVALQTPELVIALCGPIGSPLHEVSKKLEQLLLDNYDYLNSKIIRLSSFIEEYGIKKNKLLNKTHPFDRINQLITIGNEMRQEFGSEILAKLAIKQIIETRVTGEDDPSLKDVARPSRVVHIIDSIKNQSELEILKLVYGDLLYTIGVYSPLPVREKNLKSRGLKDAEISTLIDRDSGEEIKEGQTVRQTFPFSDYFLRIENTTSSEITRKVTRFLNLVLGVNPLTPTVDEMAMYSAASAAGHSACLSRQVGACVTTKDGKILSTGWNDVPKFGGGLYVASDVEDTDQRCWNKEDGKCFNDEEKDVLSTKIVDLLTDNKNFPEIDKEKLFGVLRNNSSLKDLIEFSRSIHAEMHAILRALQHGGNAVTDGRIYVTTYPCHSSARHIIAAGIVEVYFIEPYRKSLTIKLHNDAMTEEESELNKVVLRQYDGVAPSRFMSFFKSTTERKNNGKLIRVSTKKVMPVTKLTLEAIPRLEAMVVKDLDKYY